MLTLTIDIHNHNDIPQTWQRWQVGSVKELLQKPKVELDGCSVIRHTITFSPEILHIAKDLVSCVEI